jgi:dihydroneopterin aldolase
MTTDETAQAFAHPLARAEAMAGPDPLDRISLRNHVVEAEIGAFQVERGVQQRLRFDIVVEVLPLGDAGDDVDRILSYDKLAEAVAAELAAERLNLLETLAERVAARILREPQAERVFLRIEKLDREPDAPRPRVVVLGPSEIDSPRFRAMLDVLEKGGAPLLLVAPAAAAPVASTEDAQRHIDLLAADQGAWLLAGRDERLVVAATRTEVDWNLRRWTPTVWAPSKVALDEHWLGSDTLLQALMFGGLLDAIEVVVIGPSLGGIMEAPVRVRSATLEAPLR